MKCRTARRLTLFVMIVVAGGCGREPKMKPPGPSPASAGKDQAVASPGEAPVESATTPPATTSKDRETAAARRAAPPGSGNQELLGLFPQPLVTPDGSRWQLETRHPWSEFTVAEWSPAGDLIACGGEAGDVRLYKAGNLELAAILSGHRLGVLSLAWSADGKLLATSGTYGDDAVKVWRSDGTPVAVLQLAEQNQSHQFWGTVSEPTVASRGALMQTNLPWPSSVTWNSDGSRLAAGYSDGRVRIWQLDGSIERTLAGHQSQVYDVAWSPDGRWLASASEDQTIRLWGADGQSGPQLSGHKSRVWSVAWSRDSRHIASVGAEGTVRVWQADGKPLAELAGPDEGSVCWSPDGQWLAVAGYDNGREIRLWKASDHTVGTTVKAAYGTFYVCWSPDGAQFATCGANIALGHRQRNVLELWNADGSAGPKLSAPTRRCRYALMASSADGEWIYFNDHICRSDGSPALPLKVPDRVQRVVGWSPDAKQLAMYYMTAFSHETRVALFDVDGTAGLEIAGQGGGWSPDGRLAVWPAPKELLDSHKTINLFQADGSQIGQLPVVEKTSHSNGSISWSPDGSWLAYTAEGSTVYLVSADGKQQRTLSTHDGGVIVGAMVWSPDGKWVASGSGDRSELVGNEVRIWNIENDQERVFKGHRGMVTAVAWSGDGQRLASASYDRTLRIWKRDGSTESVIDGFRFTPGAVEWNQRTNQLLIGTEDQRLMLWDVETGAPVWVAIRFADDQVVRVTAAGDILDCEPDLAEQTFVFVVESENGATELFTPTQFRAPGHGQRSPEG